MRFHGQGGFTLAELLVAFAVIAVGLAAIMAAIPFGAFGVQEGNQMSTATFLADQKLEQVRNVPWTGTLANDCLGISASPTAAPRVPAAATCTYGATTVAANGTLPWLADEGTAAIAGFSGYSRQVRITDCGVGAGCTGVVDSGLRLVTVTVTYTPLGILNTPGGSAPAPKALTVAMLISQR
jgi:prepilin-type N-terminal cleavage/methylation domain-containing protein